MRAVEKDMVLFVALFCFRANDDPALHAARTLWTTNSEHLVTRNKTQDHNRDSPKPIGMHQVIKCQRYQW